MDVGLVDDPSYQWGPASSPRDRRQPRHRPERSSQEFVRRRLRSRHRQRRCGATAHDEYPSWATLTIAPAQQRTVIVTNGGKYIRGLDAQTGRELWRFPTIRRKSRCQHRSSPTIWRSSPVATRRAGGPSTHSKPNAQASSIRSRSPGRRIAAHLTQERLFSTTATSMSCTDNGILSAYEPATGQRIYQQRVSPSAGGFSASPVAAAGRLYLSSEDGDVFVVRAGRTFELLATNRMGEIMMATPHHRQHADRPHADAARRHRNSHDAGTDRVRAALPSF